tara:strand:+ start:472 stop:654 length:183 start_codon:yes stop_codon:yes gene_type:complete
MRLIIINKLIKKRILFTGSLNGLLKLLKKLINKDIIRKKEAIQGAEKSKNIPILKLKRPN